MVGDEVHDLTLRMVLVSRLLVQCGLHPSGPGELQLWHGHETTDRVLCDLPVDPVVVVAVSSEQRRREVENVLAFYYQWRVQRLADRCLGVAREVLPRPVEERATQLTLRLGAFERTNKVRPVVEHVVVVCGELSLPSKRLVESEITG